MTTMVCDNCGRTGIEWVGPLHHPTGTKCPHCGGVNCQRACEPETDYDGQPDEMIDWRDDDPEL